MKTGSLCCKANRNAKALAPGVPYRSGSARRCVDSSVICFLELWRLLAIALLACELALLPRLALVARGYERFLSRPGQFPRLGQSKSCCGFLDHFQ